MELRIADPRTLRENPNNPRRTASSPEADAMLQASIKAIGIIQPPVVRAEDDGLVIVAGGRRVRAATAAGLSEIHVFVTEHADGGDDMRALSENIVRAPMSAVDQWRATEKLIALGWTEDGVATALSLPVRTIRKLRLLADIHPAMLDQMAKGDLPDERQLRIISAAGQPEQAQVWKRHKPKKTEGTYWQGVAHALDKRRMEARHARFDDDLAKAYGIIWMEDLFAPADEDTRYTTEVAAFLGAQQEWLGGNLPKNGVILQLGEYDQLVLPKGAERVYSKPGKSDVIGCYVDPRDGQVQSIAYRMPAPKTKDKPGKGDAAGATPVPRPTLTRKGQAMLGDLRTDALHQALREAPVEAETLLALMVLAFSGDNVCITSASSEPHCIRRGRAEIVAPLVVDGAVTVDALAVAKAAREMLADVLSCRTNASNSGVAARLAGAALDADTYLPNMATPEFLACLSRDQIEQTAHDNGLPVRARLKDTRESLAAHFTEERFIPPLARFQLSQAEAERIEDYQTIEPNEAGGEEPGDGENPNDPRPDLEEPDELSDAA